MQPTPYERQADFSGFSAANPARQQRGDDLDAEFDAIATTLGDALRNLALIQRGDGALANGSVGIDQIDDLVRAMLAGGAFRIRGAWATATTYAAGDLYSYSGAVYLVMVAHTSSVSVAVDVAAAKVVGPIFDPQAVSTLRTQLAAEEGAASVGYCIAPGTTERDLLERGRDWVSARDRGAVGDGLADDTDKIQTLISQVGSHAAIHFPAGASFKLSAPLSLSGLTDIHFIAHGATIKGAASRFESYFDCSGASRITFEGFTFDQMKSSLPVYSVADYGQLYNVPILVRSGSDITVRRCKFYDLYTSGIYFYGSTDLLVEACEFTSGVQSQNQWMQHVHLQSSSGRLAVRNNVFSNSPPPTPATGACAVYASGIAAALLEIHGNKTYYCGRDNTGSHRLGVFDIYGDAQNVRVTDNVAENCMAQFMRLSSTRSGVVSGNRIKMNTAAELDYSILTVESVVVYPTSQVGAQDIVIENNTFEDPAHRAAFGVGVLSYDWGAPSTNVLVYNNSFSGLRKAVYVAGPYSGVTIDKNEMRGHLGQIYVEHNGTNASAVTSTFGAESAAVFERLAITRNTIVDSSNTNGNGIVVNLAKSPSTTATVRDILIERNRIRATPASSSQAISVYVSASTLQGRVSIVGNETENYANDWYVRSAREVVVRLNRAIGSSSAPYLDDGFNGIVERRGNRLSIGALQGTATLVAGTATILTVEVRTGDTIVLSRTTAGGTLGHLSVGTIVDATSFVINSSSATDTSTVAWEIVH